MTKEEKSDLAWKVRFCIGQGMNRKQTIEKLMGFGFQKATINKYYTAFNQN